MQDRFELGDHFSVDLSLRTVTVHVDHNTILNVKIGDKIPDHAQFHGVVNDTERCFEAQWINGANLKIEFDKRLSDSSVAVYDFTWTTDRFDELADSFQLSPYHWYGGSEVFRQTWPIENNSHPMWTYTTNDIYNKSGYGNVMERYWLVSSHVALTVDEDVPLLVSINDANDGLLRLLSRYLGTIYSNFVDDPPQARPCLKYKLWLGIGAQDGTLKALHLNVVNKHLGLPKGIPDRKMFQLPIWTTWARFKKDIDENVVLNFAKEIVEYNFPFCHLAIDDAWAEHYGDLTFDPIKFPNAKRMVDDLHAMGFPVTVWVHPFANADSETAKDLANVNFWVKDIDGTPAYVEWWNGRAYPLDMTNEEAVRWFVGRLNEFKSQSNVDSFKFDAGETNYLPTYFKLHKATNPNQYTTNYSKLATELGSLIEARCNVRNQNEPTFLRVMDKDSNWTYENGLKSLIPNILLFGLLNRPFILPDMIGGNAYNGRPDRELFIRWTEANVFLPSMEFSISPWEYDDECVKIVRNLIELHRKYADEIINLAETSTIDGSPIVRPLWWTGDESEQSLICDSQFMFGDNIVVAPVLDQGATSRSVYLPHGSKWLGVLDGNIYDGGATVNQKATLGQLPYFIRQI